MVAWGIAARRGKLEAVDRSRGLCGRLGALWDWGRKVRSSWPKWCLLVLVSLGTLGDLVLTFTQSPLSLIPAALCLAALIMMLRGWPQLAVDVAALHDPIPRRGRSVASAGFASGMD